MKTLIKTLLIISFSISIIFAQSWITVDYIWYGTSPSLKSNSNDLYLIFNAENTIGYPDPVSIKLRQYDAAPLAPTNLTVSATPDRRPKLQWSRNNEADIAYYKIYKYKYAEQGWFILATVSKDIDYFVDSTEIVTSGPHQANETYVYYKITAVDYKPYESPFSNSVSIRVYGLPLEKSKPEFIKDFYLENNYPNPFNPETKIRFAIPSEIQAPVYVRLSIYNSLGQLTSEIIKGNYNSGIYEVTINADKLKMNSGVYYYELTAGDFRSIKKMLLIK